MREEAIKEIERRFNLLSENATPNTVAYGTTGSKVRFNMALNLLGGEMGMSWSMNKDVETIIDWEWTDKDYRNPVLTEEEFSSNQYDEFLTNLHIKLLNKFK